jgi:hypothetical protein
MRNAAEKTELPSPLWKKTSNVPVDNLYQHEPIMA